MIIKQSFVVPTTVATITAAGGFIVGYKIAERRLVAQFEIRLEKETEGMREFYETVKKPYATPQEAAKALIDHDLTATVISDKIQYHKIVKKEYQTAEVIVDIPEQDDREPADQLQHHNVFVEQPIIISQEEFMQNDTGYAQSTLTFYRGDHVLTDERENPIDDLNEVVGADNMLQFGKNSSDPNVLHIRNGRLQMEFEICLSENSYRQEILGIDTDPPTLPSGRQRS